MIVKPNKNYFPAVLIYHTKYCSLMVAQTFYIKIKNKSENSVSFCVSLFLREKTK